MGLGSRLVRSQVSGIAGRGARWVAGVLAAVGLVACSGGGGDAAPGASAGTATSGGAAAAGGVAEVSIYTMQLKPSYTAYMEGVFAAFEKAHPGVKVKWIDVPAQDYTTKLLSLVAGGKSPDVQNLPYEDTLNMAGRGLLLNLDDKLTSAQKDMYVGNIVKKACTVDGKLVALPWYVATKVIMYNKEMFKAAGLDPEKPPVSATEAFAMARAIKAKTGKFGFMMNFSESGQMKDLLVEQAGVALTTPDMKKATFNTPEATALVTEYKKLFDEGVIPRESVTAEHRRAIELFKTGQTAMLISGPQFLLGMEKETPEVYKAVGVGGDFPMKGTGEFAVAMQNLCVSAKSTHPKEATELALWVSNGENQLAFSKMVTIFPSVTEALKDPYFTKAGDKPEDKARAISATQLPKATISVPALPRMSELNKVMEETMGDVLARGMDPAKALADAEAKWTAVLSK